MVGEKTRAANDNGFSSVPPSFFLILDTFFFFSPLDPCDPSPPFQFFFFFFFFFERIEKDYSIPFSLSITRRKRSLFPSCVRLHRIGGRRRRRRRWISHRLSLPRGKKKKKNLNLFFYATKGGVCWGWCIEWTAEGGPLFFALATAKKKDGWMDGRGSKKTI